MGTGYNGGGYDDGSGTIWKHSRTFYQSETWLQTEKEGHKHFKNITLSI